MIEGIKSDPLIIDLIQRLSRLPELATNPGGNHVFNIMKDGNIVSTWSKLIFFILLSSQT